MNAQEGRDMLTTLCDVVNYGDFIARYCIVLYCIMRLMHSRTHRYIHPYIHTYIRTHPPIHLFLLSLLYTTKLYSTLLYSTLLYSTLLFRICIPYFFFCSFVTFCLFGVSWFYYEM
jgi:hypothetical protein